jgi:hypothetical protein
VDNSEHCKKEWFGDNTDHRFNASPDLKTIIVYSTVANNIKYNEATKEGTYDTTHQLLDVFRLSELLAGNKDELNLKLKK